MTNNITEPYFDGIYSSDTLTDITIQPKMIICNTHPSHKEGEHWLLFFFEKNNVDFFDSLGKKLEYYGREFTDFVKMYADTYQESNDRIQPINSSLCGYYCLYYAYYRCKGYDMNTILNKMSVESNNIYEFVLKKFCICEDIKCILLQRCKCL